MRIISDSNNDEIQWIPSSGTYIEMTTIWNKLCVKFHDITLLTTNIIKNLGIKKIRVEIALPDHNELTQIYYTSRKTHINIYKKLNYPILVKIIKFLTGSTDKELGLPIDWFIQILELEDEYWVVRYKYNGYRFYYIDGRDGLKQILNLLIKSRLSETEKILD